MDSHQQFNKKAIHITDTFFHEELSKLIGWDAGYEWLQANNARSSSSPSSHASKQSTPQHSAATSPRKPSLILSCPDVQEKSDHDARASPRKSDAADDARQNYQKLTAGAGTLQNTHVRQESEHPVISTEIDQHICKIPGRGISPRAAESAMLGRIGLLYTDAAHAVLEDRDVAYYIQHTIGRPLP